MTTINEMKSQETDWAFDEIKSRKLEERIMNVFCMEYPKLNNRLYVGYAFRGCHVSIEQAMRYFDMFCRWKDYNHETTERILRGIYNIKAKDKKALSESNYPLPSGINPHDIIRMFFVNAKPVRPMNVPVDNREAAYFYFRNGYIPLPKQDGKKHPYVKYTQYRDGRYPIGQIAAWDWSHGVCLLGTKTHCFLDVDAKGVQHFDTDLLWGWHFERTPSGGYHVFGSGNLKSNSSLSGIVEIKGNTNLIVAAPTSRYVVGIMSSGKF